jgi:hypothetical protein
MVNIAFQSVFCLKMHQNNIFDTSTLRRFKNIKKFNLKLKNSKTFKNLFNCNLKHLVVVVIIIIKTQDKSTNIPRLSTQLIHDLTFQMDFLDTLNAHSCAYC